MDTRSGNATQLAEMRIRNYQVPASGLIRNTARDIVPTGIQARLFGEFTYFSNTASGEYTLANGEQVLVTFNLTSKGKYDIAACEYYLDIYADSIDLDNQIP